MSVQDHQLDTARTRTPIGAARPAVPASRLLMGFAVPVLFILLFVPAYLSALHAPVPHDLALTIAGPDASTSRIASGIHARSADGFDITRTTDTAAATRAVADRSAVGALLVDASGSTVTTVIASGGGAVAAGTVRQVGALVAQQLGATSVVRDVAPPHAQDTTGGGIFYLVVLCIIGGFLTVLVTGQALPGAARRTRLPVALAAGVIVPLISVAALSLSVGGFETDFGHFCAVVGVAMLCSTVVTLLSLFLQELIGGAWLFAIAVICLVLNLPSSGGSVPESMLPPAWQAIHAVWFGSGALETVRSLVYFGGNGFAWPFARLVIWLGAAAVGVSVMFVIGGRRDRRERPTGAQVGESGPRGGATPAPEGEAEGEAAAVFGAAAGAAA